MTGDGDGGHTEHVVAENEGISAIAERHGHFAPTIWNDPKNADLAEARTDADVLVPGDALWIPALREGEATVPTGARHRFRRRGVPARLRLRLLRFGHPRADEPYELTVGGRTFQGRTDADGWIEVYAPTASAEGTLHVGGEEIVLRANALRPVDTDDGLRQRLRNLGFLSRSAGSGPDVIRAAVEAFQGAEEIEVTGEADDATRESLRAAHDDTFGGG